MKTRILFASVLFSLFFTNSFGQKNIVKLQIGYGIPLANSLSDKSTQSTSKSATITGVYGTYGSGLRLEAGYIRSLNTHLSVELDATYLIGKSINSYSTYSVQGVTESQSSFSHFYEISPLLRVNLGGNKIRPYAAIGPVVGFGTITTDYIGSSQSTTDVLEIQQKYNGSAAFGAKSVVGTELTQGRFIFYAQVTMIAMSYAPSKSAYTKYAQNGTDQLNMIPISEKQFVYKNSYTVTLNPDPDQPKELLKSYAPFSNISMNVGVMFKF